MIYTITINPALDYYMSFDHKITGHQKTSKATYFPGGKGINASKLFSNLGIKNKAVAVIGGINGKKFAHLARENQINLKGIEIQNELRINVKANFLNETIEQNYLGEKVNPIEINNKLIKVLGAIGKKDTILIMGSLPRGYTIDNLEEIVKFIKKKGAHLVFDVSDSGVINLLKYSPLFIKPNLKELEQMFNVKIIKEKDINKYVAKILNMGAQRVIVSRDKSGGYYFDKNISCTIKSPTINEVNGSGSGDSMVAAFTYSLIKKLNIDESLKLAAGAGTATAATKWIANKDAIVKYKKLTIVKEKKWK